MSTVIRVTSWSRRLTFTCALVVGVALTSLMAKAPSTVKVLSFTIDDSVGAVFSDGKGQYIDYRLASGQSNDLNYCVDAAVDNSGGTFIRLNRKLDGDAGTMYCGLFGGTPRQFTLKIDKESACNELYLNSATPDPHAPCTVTGSDKPRIRLENVYASKPSTTPVAFLILSYSESPVNYVVRTDFEAAVSIFNGDTNLRRVTYAGKARLWQGRDVVADAFDLPFRIDFERTSVTP